MVNLQLNRVGAEGGETRVHVFMNYIIKLNKTIAETWVDVGEGGNCIDCELK